MHALHLVDKLLLQTKDTHESISYTKIEQEKPDEQTL